MLQCLHVRDLALFGSAEVRFAAGLNVLSGTTGGGKSLIITALKLLRGGKASASMIRHGAEELRVDGEFVLGQGERSAAITELATEILGAAPENDVLLITRTVDLKGRSKVRIDGRPATLQSLRALCEHLLEIHGQGETRALMRPEIQAETLDAFAGTNGLRHEFAERLGVARDAAARRDEGSRKERERLERIEFLRFRLTEMNELALQPGELEDTEREHAVLANLDALQNALESAVDALQDGEPSAGSLVASAQRAIQDAAEFDPDLAEPLELLEDAVTQVDEAARALVSRRGALDLDSSRLADVEDRLSAIRRGLKRFGPTETEFFQARDDATAELDRLDGGDEGPEAVERRARETLDALAEQGRKLVRARRRANDAFAKAVQAELRDLGMADTEVQVTMPDVTTETLLEESTAHGPGPLDFEVRINPGEPWQSLRETASGGETARIVLAIKKCLADQERVPFVVFDEIDAEIGGRLGLQVGRKLAAVSRTHQTLIVTHLPQVAAFADAHFKVEKSVRDERTWSSVDRLGASAIERELAAMSAGDGAESEALAEARRLVQKARGGTPKKDAGKSRSKKRGSAS